MAHRGINIRKRINKDGTASFEIRWREIIDGTSRQCSRTVATMVEAQEFARTANDVKGVVKYGRSLVADRLRKPGDLDLAIEVYCAHIKSTSKSTSSYVYNCQNFLTECRKHFKWTRTNQIGHSQLRRLGEVYGMAHHSHWSSLLTWKRFLTFTRSEHAVDPTFADMKMKRPSKTKMRAFTEDERERILAELQRPLPDWFHKSVRRKTPELSRKMRAYCDFRARQSLFPLVWLMLHWAPRPLECVQMCISDFDPVARTLAIQRDVAKNSCPRMLNLDPETADILARSAADRKPDAPLFLSYRNLRWQRNGLSRCMRRILQRLHIAGSLYSARHHACTMLAQLLPGQIQRVMELTGHRDIREFQRYMHAIQDDGQAAARWVAHRSEIRAQPDGLQERVTAALAAAGLLPANPAALSTALRLVEKAPASEPPRLAQPHPVPDAEVVPAPQEQPRAWPALRIVP